jgi:ubiquinone/menaquinone biosynthesis C-methylase UbiE
MLPREIDKMHRLEETHWWFQGKKMLVEQTIAAAGVRGGRLLDVGCGTGMFLRVLARYGRVSGVDISEQALAYCREKVTADLTLGSGDQLPFPDGSFCFVSLLDIIEHASDDLSVLKEAYRVCRPGGVALVTVPAFPFLWGNHDVAHHHKRRYRLPELRRVGKQAGFTVERITYTNFSIFLPVLIRRTLLRWRKSAESDLVATPALLNKLLLSLESLEACFLSHADFPWGVSLLMLLRKPGLRLVTGHG